jgi:SAM-dependent methyltransferase
MSDTLHKYLKRYLNVVPWNLHGAMMNHKLRKKTKAIRGVWLDIGAGDAPYKNHFHGAKQYLTTNTKRHYSPDDVERLNPVTSYWINDGTELPMADKSLDGVVSFQVLSVIKEPGLLFQEVNRVLKPGGVLLLSTDFLYPVWSQEDVCRLTANRIAEMMNENGFQVVEKESFGGFFSLVYMLYVRFLRAYPARWKKRTIPVKFFAGLFYLLALITLPLTGVFAFLVYLAERDLVDYTDDTYNLWVTAMKR